MSPLNHSGQMALPPIFSGDVEVLMAPLTAELAVCVPLTKRRCVAPS
jgi:hypothetical protein